MFQSHYNFCPLYACHETFQVKEEPEPDDVEQSIRLKFMCCIPGGRYVWPEPVTDIRCTLDPPVIQNKRMQLKFDE